MPELLKNRYFTPDSISEVACVMKTRYPKFNQKRFIALVFTKKFQEMELMAKMHHTTRCLHKTLPTSYEQALLSLSQAAPEIKGVEALCLPDFVSQYGLDHWSPSLEALVLFTQYSTSEFAVRPFIIKNPKRALAWLKKQASHKSPHVRRFASEGCRPRLPWAIALPVFKDDPSLILPILDKLKNDDSKYVRKSVANNLNDISKDNPDQVLYLTKQWQGKSPDTDWIVKHGCRTLLRAGNRQAMNLFGFGDPKQIEIKKYRIETKQINIGDSARFSFTLSVAAKQPVKVRLEYAVYYQKARNRISRKVFKISEFTCHESKREINRNHSFVERSTRKHYPGKHEIALIINGVEKARAALTLKPAV